MKIVVDLNEIIQGMELQSAEMNSFLNLKTGEIASITREEFRAADSDKPLESFPDWQQENILTAQEILEEEHYIPLPSQFDIDEHRIMEKFCLAIADDKLQGLMYNAIKGSGAFRRFKENIHRYGLAEDWYKYRDEAIKRIAIAWCEGHKISCK